MEKRLGFELEDVVLLIAVAKPSHNAASVSLYVMKTFDITNHENEDHESCLPDAS